MMMMMMMRMTIPQHDDDNDDGDLGGCRRRCAPRVVSSSIICIPVSDVSAVSGRASMRSFEDCGSLPDTEPKMGYTGATSATTDGPMELEPDGTGTV